jgi:hypothetical protein
VSEWFAEAVDTIVELTHGGAAAVRTKGLPDSDRPFVQPPGFHATSQIHHPCSDGHGVFDVATIGEDDRQASEAVHPATKVRAGPHRLLRVALCCSKVAEPT